MDFIIDTVGDEELLNKTEVIGEVCGNEFENVPMACPGCDLSFANANKMGPDEVLDFLIAHGVFKESIACGRCGNVLSLLRKTQLGFRCNKMVGLKKKKRAPCGWCRSAKVGSIFNNVHLSLSEVWELVTLFLHMKPPRIDFIRRNCGHSSRTIAEWYGLCRNVLMHHIEMTSQVIGGAAKIVEIDEAVLDKKRYHRGRQIRGQRVLGGIDQNSKKTFLVPVLDTNSSSLIPLIETYVSPGSTVINEACLSNAGYSHLAEKHDLNFIDPKSAKSDAAKNGWREVRGSKHGSGVVRKKKHGYFSEYLFKRKYPEGVRLHHFFNAAASYSADSQY